MEKVTINSLDPNSSICICKYMSNILNKLPPNREICIICIGTDRCTGDSLGPLVGYKLRDLRMNNIYVYGTLNNPIHATNLEDSVAEIKKKHDRAFTIGIDASLGLRENIGYITIGMGSLEPGAGMKKKLGYIGDMYIKGIVNVYNSINYLTIQNTRLSIVMQIADSINIGLRLAFLKQKNISKKLTRKLEVRR